MTIKKPAPPRDALIRTIHQKGNKKEAAKYYGVSEGIMLRWCKERDIKNSDIPNPYSKGKKPTAERMLTLVKKHGKLSPVARELNTSFSSVKGWCEEYGIEFKVGPDYEQSDIPLILELAESLTRQQIADKWETSIHVITHLIRKHRAA